MAAYLEILTTEGFKFAFIKKAKEKKGVLNLKITKKPEWLPELPSNGVGFEIVPK